MGWTNVVVLMVLIMCGVVIVMGSSHPECPQQCHCDKPSEAICVGGEIPSLDPGITTFEIKDAPKAIPVLSIAITHSLHNLESLQLDSIGLNEVEGGALAVIEHLHTLHINNNNITTLYKQTFTNCSTLMHLDLRSNDIQDIRKGTFEPLMSLRNLILANNALTTLPQHLPLGLQVLDIEYNNIANLTILPDIRLQSLNLCHNLITHIDPTQISLKTLKAVCLGGQVFNLASSMGGIKILSEVEQLTLKGTHSHLLQITPRVQKAIHNFSMNSLQMLQLDSCSIMNTQIFNLANSTLTSLKATNVNVLPTRTRIGNMDLPSIVELDFTGSPTLATLFLTPHHSTIMLDLKVLKMSRCNIKSFQESFLKYRVPNVTKLDLSHNPLECNCYGMAWIPDYVRDDKLILLQELTTTCTTPPHLNNIPLLTASMCPAPTPTTPSTIGHYFTRFTLITSTTKAIEEFSNSTTTTITPHLSFTNFIPTTTASTRQPLKSFSEKIDGEVMTESGENNGTVFVVIGVMGTVLIVIVVVAVVVLLCRRRRGKYRHRGFSGAYNRTTSSDSDTVEFNEGGHDSGGTSGGSGLGGMD